MILDITRELKNGMAVWPGDTAFSLTQSAWGSLTVGAMTLSLHTGTHADAPSHFLPGGQTIEQVPPEVYVGECVVIDGRDKEILGPELFAGELPPRVLVRTDAWPDDSPFPQSVPALTESAVEVLRAQKVFLVGVDVPSVDAIDSKDLLIHHALARAGIHIIESLDLSRAEPGRYFLIALPLPLRGGDASPVRAILKSSSGKTFPEEEIT
jgi:arylformamidase